MQKGGRDTIFSIFGRNSVSRNSKPSAIAFVDYEHWYISMYRMYHRKPDIKQWRSAISELYDVHDILFFGDFSNPSLRAEISKIREVSSSIIETQNASSYHKKDYTDFIMLDHIYQRAITYGENTDVFIIFSGDGHFSSAASFLVNRCGKIVAVYGIRDCLSMQLKNTASVTVEWPPPDSNFDSGNLFSEAASENIVNRNVSSADVPERKVSSYLPVSNGEIKANSSYAPDSRKETAAQAVHNRRTDGVRILKPASKFTESVASASDVQKEGVGAGNAVVSETVSGDNKKSADRMEGSRNKNKSAAENKAFQNGISAKSDDIFTSYYKDILTNIRFLEKNNTGKMQMKYTYGGTVDSVSAYYGVDRDMVSVALDRLCNMGYIEIVGGMLKNSKTFTVNWEKAVKDKLI